MLESLVQVLAQKLPGVLYYHNLERRLQFFNLAYARLHTRLTGCSPRLGEIVCNCPAFSGIATQVEEAWQ
ncbi:MAG: hypothetical protein ACUVR8_08415 [Acidobacteriota bacterium]